MNSWEWISNSCGAGEIDANICEENDVEYFRSSRELLEPLKNKEEPKIREVAMSSLIKLYQIVKKKKKK